MRPQRAEVAFNRLEMLPSCTRLHRFFASGKELWQQGWFKWRGILTPDIESTRNRCQKASPLLYIVKIQKPHLFRLNCPSPPLVMPVIR
jgi:hypothetical protein